MSRAARNTIFWVVALLALMAFAFQGSRGLWEPDEGRYTAAGINMLRSGDWLVPTLDGEHPHLTKPPVVYWTLAASFAAFGANEWAARLPGALAFIGTGLLVFGIARRLCPVRPALPAVIWSLSLAPLATAHIVSTDSLLILFETAAMFAFVEAWSTPSSGTRSWIRLMWAAWGLAFLTKGPPGLLPLLGVIVFLALCDRTLLRTIFDPAGLLLFAVIAGAWFGLVIRHHPERLGYLLGYEVYGRVFTATHRRNAEWYGGFVVYLPVLLVGALPWSVLAVIAAGGPRAAWSALRARVRDRRPEWLLPLCWFLVPLLVFVLARSRLPLYVVPLFAPLSIMFARALARWPWLTQTRLQIVGTVTALILIGSKAVLSWVHTEVDSRPVAAAIARVIGARRYDRITFLDMRPYYGLDVYLGRLVRPVPIDPGARPANPLAAPQDLCTEIARRQRTLFVVKQGSIPHLLEAAARCDHSLPVEVGRFNVNGKEIALFMMPDAAAGTAG